MSNDASFLNELWNIVKPQISANDRQSIADALVELCDEHHMLDGVEHEADLLDSELSIAVKEHLGLDDEDEDDEDDYS